MLRLKFRGYAYNQATHNMNGLIESLERHKVTNLKERQTILRLSDLAGKGTQYGNYSPIRPEQNRSTGEIYHCSTSQRTENKPTD
mgnify:CR=1 FL=1